MTPEEAVARAEIALAHAWMIRTFLKHADEIQSSVEMLEVPRTLYDSIRSVEPARERGDVGDFLRRLRGKLGKIRRVAHYFRDHFRDFSPHTNYEMASVSLLGVVAGLEEILGQVDFASLPAPRKPESDPIDDLDIPEV